MIYDLMHKDTAVLRMRLNDEIGLIESVEDVLSLRHLPVGTFQNGFLDVERVDAIVRLLEKRVSRLRSIAKDRC